MIESQPILINTLRVEFLSVQRWYRGALYIILLILDELQFTRKSLPKSLESDSLLANAGWEAISLFNKNGEDVKSFEDSLKYCAQIENAVLKQGVTTLIWHSSINKKIAALTNLIEKVKKKKLFKTLFNIITFKIEKAPKDRLLRKDTGIPEHEIIKFLENSLILLDLIMDSNCSVNEVPIFNYDNVCFYLFPIS